MHSFPGSHDVFWVKEKLGLKHFHIILERLKKVTEAATKGFRWNGEIFKTTYFEDHIQMAASEVMKDFVAW